MGVENFYKIRITFPTKGKKKPTEMKVISEIGSFVRLTSLRGVKICVDASLIIYNAILAVEHLSTLTDSEGRPTAHINTIFNKVVQLKECGIEQIWIFDSPEPNEIKKIATEKRTKRREEAIAKGYKNKEKVQYRLNKTDVEDIQNLLKKMGVMYITAPPGIEAEQYGAYLTKGSEEDRFCKYMLSGDSDVLCFGGNLLRITSQRSESGKTKKTVYQIFELEDILSELGFDREQFLQMCVIMGTDFASGTEGVGPGTVVDKVRKDEIPLSPRQEMAINYFKSDITDKIGSAEIVRESFNLEEVVKFLKERSFNEERIRGRLEKYNTEKNEDSEN
jgi:flap endonuclease-1